MHNIISLGIGNVTSLRTALDRLNIRSSFVSSPSDVNSDVLILPGVGSAAAFSSKLKESGFDSYLIEHSSRGKIIIGICLGFQILTNFSEESGGVEGLGLIDATTRHIQHSSSLGLGSSISHTCWETFSLSRNFLLSSGYTPRLRLTRKKRVVGRVFYNHEYGVVPNISRKTYPNPPNYIMINSSAISMFGALYVSPNIIGIQFHPEKSQHTGLDLLSLIL